MMLALIAKELRGLKAAALLIISIELLFGAYMLSTGFPDHSPFAPLNKPPNGPLISAMVFGMFLGAGLLRREATDGTLHFLDGLPLSRTRIFLAKMIAGILVLSAAPLLDIGPDVFFGWLSRTSVDAPFPWLFTLALLALYLFACAYALCVTVTLAYLGKYFGFSMGLIFLGVALLQKHGMHWVEVLNPGLLLPHWDGKRITLPWRLIGVQGGIAAAAFLIAWLWFRVLGARSRDAFDREGWVGRTVLLLARLATPVIWLFAIYYYSKATDEDREPEAASVHEEFTFANQQTEHYNFLFRESQRAEAAPLISDADSIYDQVSRFFDAPKRTERIIADLDSPMPPHMAGGTIWTKIRARITPGETKPEFRRILGHETAHVIMQGIGGKPFLRRGEFTRFFNEGMATVIEEDDFGDPKQIKAMRSLSAAIAARGPVPFSLLCDDSRLAAERDASIVYPLGSLFGRAVMRVCGEKAPARLIAEFNRSESDSKAKGEALWREVFQACHHSFDTAVAAYDADLSQLQTDEADFLQRLPRLTADVEIVKDTVIIHPKYDGKAPGELVCCVDHPALLGADLRYESLGSDGNIHVPRSDFSETKIRYMLGWSVNDLPLILFEPWAEKAD